MALTLKATSGKGGGSTERPPAGNHMAVLVGIFDMGEQWQEPYNPNPSAAKAAEKAEKGRWAHRVFFVWELLGVTISGTGKNHVIGTDLTFSLDEKAKLRKWIEARTGKPIQLRVGEEFDIATELGQPCMLNVVEKNGYPKIEGVAAVPTAFLKAMPPATYKPTIVELEQFMNGTPIPEWCPWLFGSPLEDHIKACKEIGGTKPTPKKKDAADATATTSNEAVPF